MKYIVLSFLLLTPLAYAELIEEHDCMDEAKTQVELNRCASLELKKAKTEMDEMILKIEKKYNDDPLFIQKFKASQETWSKYRDAQLEMQFPHSTEPQYYGSIYPLCLQLELTRFTRERIKILTRWLTGIAEGDVCGGSIKTQSALSSEN